jgi:OHCU decarboxylase
MTTIIELNQLPTKTFIEITTPLLEHCEWVLPALSNSRPFSSKQDMKQKLALIINNAPKEKQLQALKLHPKLGIDKIQTGFSQSEQRSAGLMDLSEDEASKLKRLNKEYELKMNFPFIIAVKGLNSDQILSALEDRITKDPNTEFQTALEELIKIAQIRIEKIMD